MAVKAVILHLAFQEANHKTYFVSLSFCSSKKSLFFWSMYWLISIITLKIMEEMDKEWKEATKCWHNLAYLRKNMVFPGKS